MKSSQERSPAQVYDDLFVPALFAQWGPRVCDEAGISSGKKVLDVACGTGALTCVVAEKVGAQGKVVGLDINEEMLGVAREKTSLVEWRQGRAEDLPFEDESFDVAVSQFGFMFFENQVSALREMFRVLRSGGRMVVAVCDALDHSPGYSVLAEMLHRLFDHQVADAFRSPFSSGDPDQLLSLCQEAEIPNPNIFRQDGIVQFDSIKALISTERACVWTLGGLLDNAQFERLRQAAEESLLPFVTPEGSVQFEMPALVFTADKD